MVCLDEKFPAKVYVNQEKSLFDLHTLIKHSVLLNLLHDHSEKKFLEQRKLFVIEKYERSCHSFVNQSL